MPEINETLKGSFTKFSGTVRKNISDGKLWYPLLCIKFYTIPQIFWNIEGMPTKFFGSVRPKFFNEKTWYPLFIHKTFWNQKFSQKQ